MYLLLYHVIYCCQVDVGRVLETRALVLYHVGEMHRRSDGHVVSSIVVVSFCSPFSLFPAALDALFVLSPATRLTAAFAEPLTSVRAAQHLCHVPSLYDPVIAVKFLFSIPGTVYLAYAWGSNGHSPLNVIHSSASWVSRLCAINRNVFSIFLSVYPPDSNKSHAISMFIRSSGLYEFLTDFRSMILIPRA